MYLLRCLSLFHGIDNSAFMANPSPAGITGVMLANLRRDCLSSRLVCVS